MTAAKAWYTKWLGGVPGKRAQYDAVDLPGVNLNFSVGPKAVVPTKGRTLDHLAFEVRDWSPLCTSGPRRSGFRAAVRGARRPPQRDHCGSLGHVY